MAFGNYQYNPYVNPYANPYNVQQIPQQMPQMPQVSQPSQNGFVWVDGIEEANSFYVAPNNAVQLWDKNAPTIYKKSADSTGKPSMQIFDLVERKPDNAVLKGIDETNFVTRTEFDELRAVVDGLTAKRSKPKKTMIEEDDKDYE